MRWTPLNKTRSRYIREVVSVFEGGEANCVDGVEFTVNFLAFWMEEEEEDGVVRHAEAR